MMQRRQKRRRQKSPALDEYLSVLKSPESRIKIPQRLDQVFKALEIPGLSVEERSENFAKKAREDPQWLNTSMRSLVAGFKERVELQNNLKGITAKHYFSAIKNFCVYNNLGIMTVNWLLLSKKLPAASSKANVRSPTPGEVRSLIKHADRRFKVLVLMFCSSGIRVGAFPYLRKKHVTPMYKLDYLIWKKRKLENEGKFEEANKIVITTKEDGGEGEDNNNKDKHVILAAKIITYPGEPEQRFTFISPEAYDVLLDYMSFRQKNGEIITDDSVIIRDEWQTTDVGLKRGANRSMASNPKGIKKGSIERYLARAEKKEGFHQELLPGVKRYPIKTVHGFRRFFETQALRAGMTKMNVDYLMGHELGISEHYFDADEFTMLDDYLKAVNPLTIFNNNNYNNSIYLQNKVAELTEKRLAELEAQQQERFKQMQEQFESFKSQIIKSEVDRLTLFPPVIEDADKKIPIQILKELFDKGYTTVPLDKSPHAYVRSEGKEEEPNNEIIKLPPNTELEAKLRRQNQEEGRKNLTY